jgi:hypothetical protein
VYCQFIVAWESDAATKDFIEVKDIDNPMRIIKINFSEEKNQKILNLSYSNYSIERV